MERPMTTGIRNLIEIHDDGVAWIIGANTKVMEVVLDKIANGWSPEEIHFQHPHLSLAQIYAALTYYYENQGQMDAQIRHGLEESGKLVSQFADADLRSKLSKLKRPL